jgi:hypothetical protein
MDDLYSRLPNLYEALADRDIDVAKITVDEFIVELKRLRETMEDEI